MLIKVRRSPLARIAETVRSVLATADAEGISTARAADQLAEARLTAAGGHPIKTFPR